MKLTVIPDAHLGFAWGTERENDAFEALEEVIERSRDSDAILIVGDFFDTRTPKQEVLARAMSILLRTAAADNSVRVLDGISKDTKALSVHDRGIPIVAIHGTHERRARGLVNPLEALEMGGHAIYLHKGGVILEKAGERVCVQGLSGVPDRYAESEMKEWRPRPASRCFNIFMIHQSIAQFIYTPEAVDIGILPRGFDLYLLGHMHEKKTSQYDGSPLIVTGSLIPTSIKDEPEAKGFWIVNTGTKPIRSEFIPLKTQRRYFCKQATSYDEAENFMKKTLAEDFEKRPVIKIKVKGEFSKPFSDLKQKFGDRAIIQIDRSAAETELKKDQKTLEEHRLSVQEIGRNMLRENLESAGLDPRLFESVFELLLEGRNNDALDILMESAGSGKGITEPSPEESGGQDSPAAGDEKTKAKPIEERGVQKTLFQLNPGRQPLS